MSERIQNVNRVAPTFQFVFMLHTEVGRTTEEVEPSEQQVNAALIKLEKTDIII